MNRHARRAGLALARATRNEWYPFERVHVDPRALAAFAVVQEGDLRACWRNNLYAVQLYARATPKGEAMHIAVRRHDGDDIQGWSDLQRIKSEIGFGDRPAVEVYPRDADVIDNAPMRHIFVLPLGFNAPFTIAGAWR